jgi:hypothetical protein
MHLRNISNLINDITKKGATVFKLELALNLQYKWLVS